VNIPDGLGVASIRDSVGGGAGVVSLTVSAPESTLKKLTVADFRAEVDLAGVRQNVSDQRVVARVVGNKDVQVVEGHLQSTNLQPPDLEVQPVRASNGQSSWASASPTR
jgi:hypothetical protein